MRVYHLHPPLLLASGLALGVLTGCASDSSDADRVVRRDSAGIEIVENAAPAWSDADAWRIEPEPVLQIGRVEGAEEDMLFGVRGVRAFGDSVLVTQSTELRVYDPQGRFVRRIGGAGEGPGEFSWIGSSLECGGTIMVKEMLTPRVTLFEQQAVRTLTRGPSPRPGPAQTMSLMSCARDGVLASVSVPPSSGPGVQRWGQRLVRMSLANASLDTILEHPTSETFDGLSVPFGRTASSAVRDSMLYLMDTGEPVVRVLGLDGRIRRIIRLAIEQRAVTDADLTRLRAQYLKDLPPSLLAEIEPRFDAAPKPATMPFFSQLRVASDGTIWLRDYQPFRDQEVTGWTVVDSSGVWLGHVELPERFTSHEFEAGSVLGVWRDENDVEFVRRYSITR